MARTGLAVVLIMLWASGARADLTLRNIQASHGPLGPERKSLDYLPHDDESLREQGDVWLGFEPAKLRGFLAAAGLEPLAQHPFPGAHRPALQLAIGRRPAPLRTV